MKKGVIVSVVLALFACFGFSVFLPIKSIKKVEAVEENAFTVFNEQFKNLVKDDDYSTIIVNKNSSLEEFKEVLTLQSATDNEKIESVFANYSNTSNSKVLEKNISEICNKLDLVMVDETSSYEIVPRYKFKRLIVNGKVTDSYGAHTVLTYKDYNILFYKTEEETKKAYEQLRKNKDINVSVVSLVKINNGDIQTNYSYSSYLNQWGAKALDAEVYKSYLGKYNHGQEIVVAVLDTGINTSHNIFQDRLLKDNNGRIVGYAGVSSKYIGYEFEDDNWADTNKDGVLDTIIGHGTHVAGTIVDLTPSNVKILPMKVMAQNGGGAIDVIINALMALTEEYSNYNIVAANLSLGVNYYLAIKEEYPYLDEDNLIYNTEYYVNQDMHVYENPFNDLRDNGILPIVSAGNESLPAAYCLPAACPNAVTVGALANNSGSYVFDTRYSNYGEVVDIVAPGTAIYAAAIGSQTGNVTNSYHNLDGTSMASPHVSAAVALYCCDADYYNAANGTFTFTADAIEQRLYNSATSNYSANGVNLSLCKGLVNLKNHGGKILLSAKDASTVYNGQSKEDIFADMIEVLDETVKNSYSIVASVQGCSNANEQIAALTNANENGVVINFTVSAPYRKNTNVSAKLTIRPCPVEINIKNQTYIYGDYNGLNQNAYTIGNTLLTSDNMGVELFTVEQNVKNAGTYTIMASIKNSNYKLKNLDIGTLTIKPRPITIKINDQSTPRGFFFDIDQDAYTITAGSMIEGDEIDINIYTEASKWSMMGKYKLLATCSNSNYEIITEGGELTIDVSLIDVSIVIILIMLLVDLVYEVKKVLTKRSRLQDDADKWIKWW